MAIKQSEDKDNKKRKNLRELIKEKDMLLVKYPEVVDDGMFSHYRPTPSSKLRDAYNKYNELLNEIETYINEQGRGISSFKPRG